MSTHRRTVERGALAVASGLLSGYAALAVAELAASLLRPRAGPLTAVGGAAVDRTPPALKDYAIRAFGENDKLVLRLGILAVLALCAAAFGLIALRHRRTAAAAVLAFGLVGAAAAVSRPDATGVADALPSVVGAVAGAAVLHLLAGRADGPRALPSADAPGGQEPGGEPGRGRRGFLFAAAAAALAATGAGALG
ncbi:molybdopterin-binding oxidoreductase, partial [Streptomyces sp. NPDC060028]